MMTGAKGRVLVTGATGYVGGRLWQTLAERGCDLRLMARRPEHLQRAAEWGVEVVPGDVLARATLDDALQGVETAYYLVHSMAAGVDFARRDRDAAMNFVDAAHRARLRRIIYLGGLGDSRNELSPHLASRQEVGRILASSNVQVIELRASIVLGSGSLSFEMIRGLTERLPVMVAPRWALTPAQPIAVEDLLQYLVLSLELPGDDSRIYEIGGPDRVGYIDLIREYARQRGLRRSIVSVPFLSPRLSSLWLGLVTPLYARVGRALIEGIRNPTIVRDPAALEVFPIRPMGVEKAIARALVNEDQAVALTRWSDGRSLAGTLSRRAAARYGNRLTDQRMVCVNATAEEAFASIVSIGGNNGWYYADWLWRLRGALDVLAGGVGMRRGRRHPEILHPGDALDLWRVEAVEPGRLLCLRAEMRLPGRAWLQWELKPNGECEVEIHQTALFDPVGLGGRAYWHLIYPFHELIFGGMLRAIALKAMSMRGEDEKALPGE